MKRANKQSVIYIDGKTQQLTFSKNRKVLSYSIATAAKGFGEQAGSFQTPRGLHRVCAKIGDGLPENAVLVGRKFTGEIYTPALAAANPERTWVLTRILWLEGLEPGKNQGEGIDSKLRYIYIHGVPDEKPMGVPGSIGCINMRNKEIIELYNEIKVDDEVFVAE